IHDRDRLAIHQPLAEVVDAALRGTLKPPQMRIRGADGAIVARIAETAPMRTAAVREPLEAPRSRGMHETISVFPYGVSRNYLEQAINELRVPIRVQNHIEEADLILTLKNYYRRKDSQLKDAEADGIPIQVLKSNTITQIKNAHGRMYQLDTRDPTESALQETLEGISRAKPTQIHRLAAALADHGYPVWTTREPGGTRVGEMIRPILLGRQGAPITPWSEALLFTAARAQHVEEVLRPRLERGELVLCDRYADSTLAYQGYGRGLDLDTLRQLQRQATGGLQPALTILLNLPVQAGLARIPRPNQDRLD